MERKLFQWRGHTWVGAEGESMGPCNMSHNSTISHTISPRSFRREQTSNMCIRVHARFRHCFINTRSGSCLLSETKSRNRSRKYRGLYRILSHGEGSSRSKVFLPHPAPCFGRNMRGKPAYSFPFSTMIPWYSSLSFSLPFLFETVDVESIFWRMIYCTFARFYFVLLHGEFNIV